MRELKWVFYEIKMDCTYLESKNPKKNCLDCMRINIEFSEIPYHELTRIEGWEN